MEIIDLKATNERTIWETAALLVACLPDSWPDLISAKTEVEESIGADRISRVAIDARGAIVEWVGAHPAYHGNVWELHPLVVHPSFRRLGIGRSLVLDAERQARERGGLTLWLGTDDEDGRTTLSGRTLYPDVLQHLADIRNLRDHAFAFYQRLGFVIVGVVPDANGPGKPDILMAKPLR